MTLSDTVLLPLLLYELRSWELEDTSFPSVPLRCNETEGPMVPTLWPWSLWPLGTLYPHSGPNTSEFSVPSSQNSIPAPSLPATGFQASLATSVLSSSLSCLGSLTLRAGPADCLYDTGATGKRCAQLTAGSPDPAWPSQADPP